MGSLFSDFSLVHYHETVSMLDGGEAVGNHDGCPALHQLFQSFLNQAFRVRINIGGCLIHDKNTGLMCQSSCKGKKLALSGGKGGATLGHRFLIGKGKLFDKMRGIYIFCCVPDFFFCNFLIIKSDIAFYSPLEDKNILLHLTDGTSELFFA